MLNWFWITPRLKGRNNLKKQGEYTLGKIIIYVVTSAILATSSLSIYAEQPFLLNYSTCCLTEEAHRQVWNLDDPLGRKYLYDKGRCFYLEKGTPVSILYRWDEAWKVRAYFDDQAIEVWTSPHNVSTYVKEKEIEEKAEEAKWEAELNIRNCWEKKTC